MNSIKNKEYLISKIREIGNGLPLWHKKNKEIMEMANMVEEKLYKFENKEYKLTEIIDELDSILHIIYKEKKFTVWLENIKFPDDTFEIYNSGTNIKSAINNLIKDIRNKEVIFNNSKIKLPQIVEI